MAADRRIQGHAADEKAGITPVFAEQKRRQCGGRRLAVRPGDDNVVPPSQHEVVQHGRQGGEVNGAGIEQPLDLGIAARHRIADHDQIRGQPGQPPGVVALVQFDAGGREHGAHGRVDARVGPEDLVTGRAGQQGGVAHRSAADPHEIETSPGQ